MELGDFTELAKEYSHRVGYSELVLRAIINYTRYDPKTVITADVGAGTGKLTENLISIGCRGYAVEPNHAMRNEGMQYVGDTPFKWIEGSGEMTHLLKNSVDWVFMGSAFHWTDPKKALAEFSRILKPGGFFIALWNPRAVEYCPIQREIEEEIDRLVPQLSRVSSGAKKYTQNLHKTLLADNFFKDVILFEAPHLVEMSRERYLGIWRSVNDIRVQAGEEKFQKLLDFISKKTQDLPLLTVDYLTRAWIVQKADHAL